jgi:putative oxidoreductase
MNFLRRYEPQAYALLRIVAGLLFAFHGLQKFGYLGGTAVPMASMLGAAAAIELVGGFLIMLGLLTTPAAFVCSGEMAVAYFMAHQPRGLWPIQNQGELAALNAFLFLFIAARGGGMCSIDSLLWRPRATTSAEVRHIDRPNHRAA